MLKESSPIIQVNDKCCDDTPKETTRKEKGYYKQEGQKSLKYKSALYGYFFVVITMDIKHQIVKHMENITK